MIVFAGLVPHPPLLIPEVGKNNLNSLKQTIESYKILEQDLYASKPEVLLLLGKFGETSEQAFVINQKPKVKVEFKNFGDLLTKLEFDTDLALGYKIREATETTLPVILSAQENLDYHVGVALYALAQHLPHIKIVNIVSSHLDAQMHVKFGEEIKEIINQSGKRIAVIASCDLSPKLSHESPAGFAPEGQEFDQLILKKFASKDFKALLELNPEIAKKAEAENAWKTILLLFGLIKNLNYTPEQLSYEAPFGIGYLVENFRL